jgi:hypothetical protein
MISVMQLVIGLPLSQVSFADISRLDSGFEYMQIVCV